MKLLATLNDIDVAYAEWSANRAKGLRLGQFIWNSFGIAGEAWPELFYCNDPNEAYTMAMLDVISGKQYGEQVL